MSDDDGQAPEPEPEARELPPELRERRPRPLGPGDMWVMPGGALRMAGPVPSGAVAVALGAAAIAGLAGFPVYAWRRDWPRLAVCTALAAACGWLAVRLARPVTTGVPR